MSLVSVIVPLYNKENTIRKTIESILNQTYLNIEIIVIDDLSTDKSVDIVKDMLCYENRIKLVTLDEKGGASIARNVGICQSKGKYVAFLDADDYWKEEKIELQVKFMEDNNYSFTYTNYDIHVNDSYVRETKSPKEITYRKLLKKNYIGCLTVMYEKKYFPNLKISRLNKRNDYALWLTALRGGTKAHLLDKSLSVYNKDSGSLSRNGSKFSLIKYHYKMYNEVLYYNRFLSIFFTIRNIFYHLV